MAAITEHFDVVVVGAGHAGCEAALACARLNLVTILYTVSVESIALMPCNPYIGGSSQGHTRLAERWARSSTVRLFSHVC